MNKLMTLLLAHFSNFWGENVFLKKIWLCHEQLHMGF